MCGRFLMNEEAVEAIEGFVQIPSSIQGQFDLGMIFPSNPSLIIYDDGGLFKAGVKNFGFMSEKLKKRIINARAETILEKWMFKSAFRMQRCLIPCAAFYEWDAAKQRISFTEKGKKVLYLAGIWMKDDFIILTTAANASMEEFHHRMPLVLSEEQGKSWLSDYDHAVSLLDLTPPALIHHYDFKPNPTLF